MFASSSIDPPRLRARISCRFVDRPVQMPYRTASQFGRSLSSRRTSGTRCWRYMAAVFWLRGLSVELRKAWVLVGGRFRMAVLDRSGVRLVSGVRFIAGRIAGRTRTLFSAGSRRCTCRYGVPLDRGSLRLLRAVGLVVAVLEIPKALAAEVDAFQPESCLVGVYRRPLAPAPALAVVSHLCGAPNNRESMRE